MKLVVHNPHVETHFAKTLFHFFTRRYSMRKYGFLFHEFKSTDHHVLFYFDGLDSSFPPILSKYIPLKTEVFLWSLINGINPLSNKIQYKYGNIDVEKNDILLSFSFRNLDRDNSNLELYQKLDCIKAIHLTHYMLGISFIAKNTQNIGDDYFFIAENNLYKNSAFFRKYFKNYKKDVYTLPFVNQDRFKNITPFLERENRCLSTGTFETISNNERTHDFMVYFNVNTFHSLRREIYRKKNKLKDQIACFNSDYNEVKIKRDNNNVFKKIYSHLYILFFVKQSNYFKFNMVQKYNNYRMFVVPEEINDLPGIGFVEGMACGCAFFGKDDPMYRDIGLIPDKHYISYSGDLDDLTAKIKFYQKNPDELQRIANNGYVFVKKKFHGRDVAEKFFTDMIQIISNDFKNDNIVSTFSQYQKEDER